MRIPFAKLSPAGNMTILLRGEFSPALRAALCVEVIKTGQLAAEQAGAIVTDPTPRLDMMGGEFCLNATRCFAALLAFEGKLEGLAPNFHGTLQTSGIEAPVSVWVRVQNEALCHAAVRLRMPAWPEPKELEPGAWLVRLPGIQHLLLDEAVHPLQDSSATDSAYWRKRHTLETTPAVGVIRFRLHKGRVHIVPVVWVAVTGAACVETACGSGSLAAALVAATITGRRQGEWAIDQAGGTLDVAPSMDDEGFSVWVGGEVRTIAEGHVFVTLEKEESVRA